MDTAKGNMHAWFTQASSRVVCLLRGAELSRGSCSMLNETETVVADILTPSNHCLSFSSA
jgi:hypothetical protein